MSRCNILDPTLCIYMFENLRSKENDEPSGYGKD